MKDIHYLQFNESKNDKIYFLIEYNFYFIYIIKQTIYLIEMRIKDLFFNFKV